MSPENFIKKLETRLIEPLPGSMAHKLMIPTTSINMQPSLSARTACVLILLVPRENTWDICLIQRQINPLDVHSGQISLPGGKLEAYDKSHLECAIRETYEEIGISNELINPLGGLTSIYTSASNFHIHPFVANMNHVPEFILQTSEVQRVIKYPLHNLTNPITKNIAPAQLENGITINNVPHYVSDHGMIWGATAMILSELEQILITL